MDGTPESCLEDLPRGFWLREWFKPTLRALRISLLDWEALASQAGAGYAAFYEQCLRFNRPPPRLPEK